MGQFIALILSINAGLFGIFSLYPFDEQHPAPRPPEGYEAFHISSYARHGARNYSKSASFDRIYELMAHLDAADSLTDNGREFFKRYSRVYPMIRGCGSDLTDYGKWQHSTHAERMLSDYPGVFRGRDSVCARSTQKPRTLLSMASFCTRMAQLRPSLSITQSATGADALALDPNQKGNPHISEDLYLSGLDSGPFLHSYDFLKAVLWNPEILFSALFLDWKACREIDPDPLQAEKDFYYTICSCYDNDMSVDLMSLCPEEEMQKVWEAENYRMKSTIADQKWTSSRSSASAELLLRDFLSNAEKDLKPGSRVAARLRFGHDCNISLLMTLLQIPFEYDMNFLPMASMLQWTFYRGKAGDILVRFSLNNNDLTLPIKAFKGSFYRWEDVKAHCAQRLEWADKTLGI